MKKLSWYSAALSVVLLSQPHRTHAQALSSSEMMKNASHHNASFEENRGQFPPEVRFLFRAPGLDAWITTNGVVYDRYALEELNGDSTSFTKHFNRFDPSRPLPEPLIRRTGHVVRMKFAGAKETAQISLADSVPGNRNYFYGNDPSKWVTDVRSFKAFDIQNLYDGIDAAYQVDGGSLRYDLVVRPGADPGAITLRFEGATKLFASDSGQLILRTSMGDLEEADLQAYQLLGGVKSKIPCSFKIVDDSTVRFTLGKYDEMATLVIDPLVYSTFLGSTGDEQATAIVIDKSYNACVTGYTNSHGVPGFPHTPGAYQTVNKGNVDVFVTKLDPSGSRLVYSTFLGGALNDVGQGIAVDALGDVFITGYTFSKASTPPAFPATNTSKNNGVENAFVTELGPGGDALIYSTYLGGDDRDAGQAIALDDAGNAYITGSTNSAGLGFPVTPGAFQTSASGQCAFVTKFDPTGAIVYSTLIGNNGKSTGYGIAVDRLGKAFIAGVSQGANGYPTTSSAFQQSNSGGNDAFVTCVSSSGGSLLYSTYLGGAADDAAAAITLDSKDNAYITGYTYSSGSYPIGYPSTPAAFQTTNSGLADVFVTKLNPTGSTLVYSTLLGGTRSDIGEAIALDSNYRACVTGYSVSYGNNYPLSFPLSRNPFQADFNGVYDDFITVLDTGGSNLVYSTYLGGRSDESGNGIACDDSGYLYIAGGSASGGIYPVGFPTTANAFQPIHGGGKLDATVTKLALASALLVVEDNPLRLSLCDRGKPGLLAANYGLAAVIIDSISVNLPLSSAGLTFPITVPADSQFDIYLQYIPNAVGPDSSYALVHYRINGVRHELSILIRAIVGNGIRFVLPQLDTMRGTLCRPLQETIRIRDTGCEAVTIVGYTLLGSHSAEYSVSGSLPTSVSKTQDAQLTISFTTTTPGTYYEVLDIQYLTSDGLKRDIMINLAATARSATFLSWGTPSEINGTICDSLVGTLNFKIAGCQNLIIDAAVLGGPYGGQFRVLNSFPFTLQPDSLGSISFEYLDRVPGSKNCLLTLYAHTSDGTGRDTTFEISATVIGGASINFAKSISIIGNTCDSLTGRASIASINCGGLDILRCTLSGKDSADFVVLNMFPIHVATNDSLLLAVKCVGSEQRSYSATAHIRYVTTDGATHDTTIAVSATLQPLAPKLAALHDFVDLGTIQDCMSADTSVTLRNVGCDTLRIDSLLTGLFPGMDISGMTFPITLAPGGQVNFHVHYKPHYLGTITQYLVFHATEQGRTSTTEVLIQAATVKGTSELALGDTTIDFGAVSVCSHKTLSATFSSAGCDSVDLSNSSLSSTSGFAILNGHSASLAPGESDSLIVQFTPPSSNSYSSDLILTTTAGTKRIHLKALGVPDSGRVELSTTAVTFATATESCDSSSSSFSMRNTGCTAITIDSIGLRGSGNPAFSTTSSVNLPASIETDSAFQIRSVFIPKTQSTYTATIHIWFHNAAGRTSDTTIMLSGVGIAPPAIGIAMKSQPLVAASDGLIDIPIYLTGNLDPSTAQRAGLQTVTIKLALNTDLLTPVSVLSLFTLPQQPRLQVDRSSALLVVPLPSNFSYNDTTLLITVRCERFITDTMTTVVRLISSNFASSNAVQCLKENPPAGESTFRTGGTCADSITSHSMGYPLEFVIQLIVPNPTRGDLQVNLLRNGDYPIGYALFDALGKAVKQGAVVGTSNTLDLKDLPSGVFFLRLATGTMVQSRMVVVQH